MAIPWSALSFVFRVVGPRIPDILSTLQALKTRQQEKTDHTDNLEARLSEIDRTLSVQLELIDQLTKQLRELEKLAQRAVTLSLLGLALIILTLGLLLFFSPS